MLINFQNFTEEEAERFAEGFYYAAAAIGLTRENDCEGSPWGYPNTWETTPFEAKSEDLFACGIEFFEQCRDELLEILEEERRLAD